MPTRRRTHHPLSLAAWIYWNDYAGDKELPSLVCSHSERSRKTGDCWDRCTIWTLQRSSWSCFWTYFTFRIEQKICVCSICVSRDYFPRCAWPDIRCFTQSNQVIEFARHLQHEQLHEPQLRKRCDHCVEKAGRQRGATSMRTCSRIRESCLWSRLLLLLLEQRYQPGHKTWRCCSNPYCYWCAVGSDRRQRGPLLVSFLSFTTSEIRRWIRNWRWIFLMCDEHWSAFYPNIPYTIQTESFPYLSFFPHLSWLIGLSLYRNSSLNRLYVTFVSIQFGLLFCENCLEKENLL